jgi:hypothetical protein
MAEVALPIQGGSTDTWGDDLNDFLLENVFSTTGYLKDPVLVTEYIQHYGDSNTFLRFGDDALDIQVGGVAALSIGETGINVVGAVQCDTLRIDQVPATASISPDKTLEVNCNGSLFLIACSAKPA